MQTGLFKCTSCRLKRRKKITISCIVLNQGCQGSSLHELLICYVPVRGDTYRGIFILFYGHEPRRGELKFYPDGYGEDTYRGIFILWTRTKAREHLYLFYGHEPRRGGIPKLFFLCFHQMLNIESC